MRRLSHGARRAPSTAWLGRVLTTPGASPTTGYGQKARRDKAGGRPTGTSPGEPGRLLPAAPARAGARATALRLLLGAVAHPLSPAAAPAPALAAALGLLVALPAAGGTLLVGAASSLREPVEEIASAFEAAGSGEVELTFGASSFLAAQIEAGAPIDVLLSADERTVDRLAGQGLVSRRVDLAGNRLVVLAAADRAVELAHAEDLLKPAVERVAVPEPAVPLGHYAREWLARRGLLEPLAPRLVPTENARATLSAVDLGNVDAAVVYATDALLARSAEVAFEVPAEEQPRIAYEAAVAAGAEPARAAERFLRFLEGPAARRALREAGFRPPPDPPESG